MLIEGFRNAKLAGVLKVFSIGGGAIQIDGEALKLEEDIYSLNSMAEIIK